VVLLQAEKPPKGLVEALESISFQALTSLPSLPSPSSPYKPSKPFKPLQALTSLPSPQALQALKALIYFAGIYRCFFFNVYMTGQKALYIQSNIYNSRFYIHV
jgi:hypothetical protein